MKETAKKIYDLAVRWSGIHKALSDELFELAKEVDQIETQLSCVEDELQYGDHS